MNCLKDKQCKQSLFLTRMSARTFARFRTFLGRVCKACRKNSGCWIRPIKWRSEVVLIRKVRAQTVTFCKIFRGCRGCRGCSGGCGSADCAVIRIAFFGFNLFRWGWGVAVAMDGFGAAGGHIVWGPGGWRRGGRSCTWGRGHGCCACSVGKWIIPHGVESGRWCVKSMMITLTTYTNNKLKVVYIVNKSKQILFTY